MTVYGLSLITYSLELKLESKNILLVRVWHSIELILFQSCMLGVSCL
jgi:hypothetical protein